MKIWTTLACASALALAATGCNPKPEAGDGNAQAPMALPALPATLPLEAGAATEITPAPSASDLPDAKPLRLARVADTRQAYGYADAAYTYDEALGDAPPDYGFDYDGADPWAWQGYDDSLMVAEPIDDGYRYYYYRPGADEPYFVRDPFYSYGYADGLLAVVYGADGGIVPYADYGPRLIYASRYYARGRQLYGASRRPKRRPVIAANWLRQRPVIVASRDRWSSGRAHQPDWQRYAEANRPRQAAYWSAEQVRRRADARRFEGWREQGFRNAPPPRAIPVQWERAKWAKDDRRYRPAAEAVRNDRQQDRRDAREDRQDARQDAQRQAQREQRQAERQAQADQPDRDGRSDQVQPDRRDPRQAQQREQRQAERQQAQQQQQAQRDARQAQQRDAQQAQRQQQREAQQREARQARQQQQQAQQREARQAQRDGQQQAQQAQRREAQQAARQQQQAQARQAQRAERQQAQQAQRQQAQQADRDEARQAQQAARQQQQAEARQAQQAQRQQAQQAQREQARQAQQAERQQAQQAQRQQQQAAQREQQQAQRQQAQQQRQQQRQERREARGPGPN